MTGAGENYSEKPQTSGNASVHCIGYAQRKALRNSVGEKPTSADDRGTARKTLSLPMGLLLDCCRPLLYSRRPWILYA